MKKEPIWSKSFISLFLTNLSVFIVFYGLVSTLPLYAKDVLNKTDKDAGLLMSIFLLSAILVRPFTGKILDVYGKRKMLWIGLVLYLGCTILYYFIEPFQGLLALRFVQGIFFSLITTAAGSLAVDNIPVTRRGAGLGYYTMSTNLAVVLGPLIGLFIIQYYSFDMLFIVMSFIMIIGVITSLSIIQKDFPDAASVQKKFALGDLFEKKALPISLLASVISFSYASVLSYLSIYAQAKDLLELASTFFLIYAAVMLVARPFTGRIFDEKGPQFVIIPGFISFIIGLILLAFMDSTFVFLFAGAFLGFGYGSIVPSFQTLAMQATDPERSGYATATFFTLFDSGLAIGSFVFGLIAISYGYQNVYLIAAFLILIASIIYVLLERKKISVVA
ncbi:MFS transporter [Sporosarcina siberiensis]|uniref:MFS transporter n=1 Tax=Sporosarcina siberiensis TaxID=1365606 RepID=A0ABW4SES3_9BACL